MSFRKLIFALCALAFASPAAAQVSKGTINTEISNSSAAGQPGGVILDNIVASYVDWLTCTGTGGLVYWSSGTPTCLGIGSAGQALTVNGGVPVWAAQSVSNLAGLGTGVATALGNPLNGSGGLVGFSGNIGAATGTSLALGGCTITGLVFCGTGQVAINNTFARAIAGSQDAATVFVQTQSGGSSLTGSGPLSSIFGSTIEGTSGSPAAIDKIGLIGSSVIAVNDASGSGSYGVNCAATVNGAGAAISRLVCMEDDIQIKAGSGTVTNRYAHSFVNGFAGVGQGGTLDSATIIANISNNSGSFLGAMVDSTTLGFNGLATTATWFFPDHAATYASFAAFSGSTFTGNIYNYGGVGILSGAGALSLGQGLLVNGGPVSLSSGQGAFAASANSGAIIDGNGTNFDGLFEGVGGIYCVNPHNTQTLNCNTLTLTNALATGSGGTGNTGGAWSTFSGTPTCGSAVFNSTTGTNKTSSQTIGKLTGIQLAITISTIGTCTTPITFTLPNTAAQGGSISGEENINSSASVNCVVTQGSATATCRKASNIAFAVNDQILVSGTYQNQ